MPGSEGNPPLESFGQHGQMGRTFVGRERELSELRASLASVAGGRGQLFCLIGEPGIGKTRLTEEIAAEAERGGAKVAWGRCWEGGGAPAYWPWMQALRHCATTIDSRAADATLPSTARQMLGLTPESRGEISSPENWPRATMLSGLPSRGRSTFDPARFELFDSIAAYLKRLSNCFAAGFGARRSARGRRRFTASAALCRARPAAKQNFDPGDLSRHRGAAVGGACAASQLDRTRRPHDPFGRTEREGSRRVRQEQRRAHAQQPLGFQAVRGDRGQSIFSRRDAAAAARASRGRRAGSNRGRAGHSRQRARSDSQESCAAVERSARYNRNRISDRARV